MGVVTSAGRLVTQRVAPRVPHLAPDLTHSFVSEALHRAIDGLGPLKPAAESADRLGSVHEVVETHVRYAGAQGLLTGLGGVLTATVTIPANLAGLALVQARMVACIAHLRGYDLGDPRVENAILTCMLGREAVDRKLKERQLPGPPMAIATAPVHDPDLSRVLTAEVATDLIQRVGGKRLAISIARRTPIVGGAFGMGADGWATWRVGIYAARELRPRNRR
ncbi:EcsC family protein [Nocardioides sp. URHA0032]|jgi:EcsC protein family|uniref:EcsC family protein n=1 Tax=Nocardioides sp. URHA0032 TaxID=1380388 RepID=UPI00048FCE8D|nr:EcsC family protein [Nocardioides sp. URHA0032]